MRDRLFNWLIGLSVPRRPRVTAGRGEPSMLRWELLTWHLRGRRMLSVYLHQFVRSDDTAAMHDHPWWSVSLILRGRYTDLSKRRGGRIVRRVVRTGRILVRPPKWAHRILIEEGDEPCWSLFVIGPHIREWGFHCPARWVNWREFNRDGCGPDIA